MGPIRTLVVWIPDWPVVAVLRDERARAPRADAASAVTVDPIRDDPGPGATAPGATALGATALGATAPVIDPIAVIEKNVVIACSPAARAEGVRRGQRRRDAQARCPRVRLVPSDPARDQRMFAPVIAAIERLAPHVQLVHPGLCALKARGPARYYGGEEQAADRLRSVLADEGITDARIGVADGPFTAEQAARTLGVPGVRIVAGGEAGAFLAPLPITAITAAAPDEGEGIAHLLSRLGVHSLGQFAALETERVRERLGESGVRLQSLAAGADSRVIEPRVPPPELHREVVFDPPVELSEQAAFGTRLAAEEFIARLDDARLVCTALRVELTGDRGEYSDRVWLHPGTFDAAAVVDRVRWQLAEDETLRSGVARVRISPEAVDAASHHVPGLFGGGAQERVHHALSRVQAMLGHRGVLTAVVGGGRWLDERQILVPWGDRAVARSRADLPWPGSLPPPWPATVFAVPPALEVCDARGIPVTIDARGALSAALAGLRWARASDSPAQPIGKPPREALQPPSRTSSGQSSFQPSSRPPSRHPESKRVLSWAGPWPVIEREWDVSRRRVAHRCQVIDEERNAWLLVHENGAWHAEARYD